MFKCFYFAKFYGFQETIVVNLVFNITSFMEFLGKILFVLIVLFIPFNVAS